MRITIDIQGITDQGIRLNGEMRDGPFTTGWIEKWVPRGSTVTEALKQFTGELVQKFDEMGC